MSENLGLGFPLIAIGGLLSGIYALPVGHAKGWAWENTWVIYVFFGACFLPVIAFLCSVPYIDAVFTGLGAETAIVCAFGILWGIASIFFGLCIPTVGQSLTFGIVLSMSSSIGSLIPFLVIEKGDSGSTTGILFWIALIVAVGGIVLMAIAGSRKDKETKAAAEIEMEKNGEKKAEDDNFTSAKKSTTVGFIMCILSGIMSPMLNIGFAYGSDITLQATTTGGAHAYFATTSIWVPSLGCGFLANLIYCIYLFIKNKSFSNYTKLTAYENLRNVSVAFLMACLWFGGTLTYGVGATALGSLGASIGWPVYMVIMIAASNLVGFFLGEWKATTLKTKLWLFGGLFIMACSVVIIAVGSTYK